MTSMKKLTSFKIQMKKVLLLCVCVTISVACVIVFASCTSQNNESDNERYDEPYYYKNEVSDDANSGSEIVEDDFVARWWGNNPWRAEYNIKYMPVFNNHLRPNLVKIAQGSYVHSFAHILSVDETTVMAKDISNAMGLEVEQVGVRLPTAPICEIQKYVMPITAISGDIEVEVGRDGSVGVVFREEGLALPEGIIFSLNHRSDEAIEYLTERFASILGVEIKTFENNSEDIIERILDYNFNNLWFSPHSRTGGLGGILRPPLIQNILSDKIGYFPIITPEEAIELMLLDQGVWPFRIENESVPTRDYIIDIQLVYFGHNLALPLVEAFIPWYSILFISPVWGDYTHYFVPAIRTDYLEANPGWSFFPHQ